MIRLFLLSALLALPGFLPVAAQTIPYLSDDRIRMISNELSGDRAFEHIRILSQWHRNSGMEGYFKAADYIMDAARRAGLEDVRFVEQPLEGRNYTARSAELWMVEPVEVKLADIGEAAVYLADGSHDADLTAELVWIGDALDDSIGGLDVAGKIVLTPGSPGWAVRRAVWGRGAAGVVAFPTSEGRSPFDVPDQIAWTSIPSTPPEGKAGTFAFVLPPRKGELLRKVLQTSGLQDHFATGRRTPGGRVVLRARVDTEMGTAPGRTGFVEAWIRGAGPDRRQVVLTAHLQEEQWSANDDGSGCANILEIGRAWTKLIREGRLPRPPRDIRFWWTDEIYSEYRYFRDHPDEPAKMLANLHQDMVGANQALGSRVQHLILAPHSITSFLDAVFESVGSFLVHTNNGFLASSRAGGYPRPFTRPLYATRGTRDGYNARFVPYFNSSDHMCFIEGAVGVPAVAAINWDDPYIHSSDDDLWQIDQTQLLRNQFLIGASAMILAYAGPADVPLHLSQIWAQGLRRLGNDMGALAARLAEPDTGSSPPGWADALALVEKGIEREERALRSVARLTPATAGPDLPIVEEYLARLRAHGGELLASAAMLHRSIRGESGAVPLPDSLTAAAMRMVPSNAGPLDVYFERRGEAKTRGFLHDLMRDEVYNFVDGRRSAHEIYRAVRAEQLAAGSWYYGTVTLEGVLGVLDAAVAAGAIWLQ